VNPAKRRAIYERFREANPNPKTELEYTTPFELLVAVVLSAQATDKSVNKATARLFPAANTPAAIAKLGVAGLTPYISAIGLFRNKAKNVVALSEILVREHDGRVPRQREALEALPGVGRKTANVVLGNAFDLREGVVVDTHVHRLSRRLGLTQEDDPEKIERDLMELVPRDDWTVFSLLLMDHGRKICKARKPMCALCPVADLCPSAEI
jgi:endonuclease III